MLKSSKLRAEWLRAALLNSCTPMAGINCRPGIVRSDAEIAVEAVGPSGYNIG